MTLFLIPGWGMNRQVWSPCLAALEKFADLQLAELSDYGESPDFDNAADALAGSIPDGAILCGWSLGALLAMQAALSSRVGALILIGATPCFVQRADWMAAQPPSLLRDFASAVAADTPAALRRFIALFNQGDTKARAITREITQGLRLPMPTSVLLAGLDWLRDVDLRERVPALDCPTLLIHGEHDPLMPLSAARDLSEKLPRARLEIFPGAAHAPFLNDPEHFVHLVGDFLHDFHD